MNKIKMQNTINLNSTICNTQRNSTEIYEEDVQSVRLIFDHLGQVIREDNKLLNKTSIFKYDKYGNIIKKQDFEYSLFNDLSDGYLAEYNYSLDNKLISYNGEHFEYDGNGYPIKYRDANFKWSGNRLLEIEDIAHYAYNENGMRISKIVNGITTTFNVKGNKILSQENGLKICFNYQENVIEGFTLHISNDFSLNFKYKKNHLGDIVGIYDCNDELFCKYVYDIWGNCNSFVLNKNQDYINIDTCSNDEKLNSLYVFVAMENPFRYRGYYYDIETGFYYHNGRYYDAEIGKFVNN